MHETLQFHLFCTGPPFVLAQVHDPREPSSVDGRPRVSSHELVDRVKPVLRERARVFGTLFSPKSPVRRLPVPVRTPKNFCFSNERGILTARDLIDRPAANEARRNHRPLLSNSDPIVGEGTEEGRKGTDVVVPAATVRQAHGSTNHGQSFNDRGPNRPRASVIFIADRLPRIHLGKWICFGLNFFFFFFYDPSLFMRYKELRADGDLVLPKHSLATRETTKWSPCGENLSRRCFE